MLKTVVPEIKSWTTLKQFDAEYRPNLEVLNYKASRRKKEQFHDLE
jgi:hypothetical protein